MSKRRINLALWLAGVLVLACSLSAGATTFNFPNSSMNNSIMDPTKWETVTLPHTNPTTDDFLSAANVWTINYKQVKICSDPLYTGTDFRIAGTVIYHGAVATSAANEDRPFFFNGNTNNAYDKVGTFDDLRLQGTIQGATTRRPYLAGKLTLIADANGNPSHTAFQIRSGQQLNITAQIVAEDCPSIDIVRYTYGDTASDSQISLRNSNNRIYGKFVLDAGLYANAAGSLGDADVEINGSSVLDYRAGKLNIQNSSAISATAKVSITTDATGMNTDPVRLNIAANNVTIRELWLDGSKETTTTYFDTSNAPAWLSVTDAGSLTVTNAAAQNLVMVASPADPNIKIYPPVGTKAYVEGYVVSLHAPNPKDAPYRFDSWSCIGGTVTDPCAADTTVTMPTGSGLTVTANYVGAACSPSPVNGQTNVSVFTDLSWTASPSTTAQTVYFGTDNPPTTAVAYDDSNDAVYNATIGRLADSTTYYWYVASTIGGSPISGPVWSFTSVNSTPHAPSPAIGEVVPVSGTELSWSEGLSAGGTTLHNVYFSTNQSLVAARTAPALTPDANGIYYSGPLTVSTTYYWAVDATYRDDANGVLGYSYGPVWNFDAQKKILYIKTEIAGYNINGAGDVNGVANGIYVDDANVVNYTFPSFNYGSDWDIVVTGDKSFAIWSDSSITIGGTMDIAGYAGTNYAPGPAHAGNNAGVAGSNNTGLPAPYATVAVNGIGYGETTSNNSIGAGAGFGGAGGRAGRYSTCNFGAGGIAYGEKELFTLYAGSGGGGGKSGSTGGAGGGGGGAVELYAKSGNVTIASTAVINANGSRPDEPSSLDYCPGGGSGGGVRLIASGNVTVAGSITADGGHGGDRQLAGGKANNTGGGGAGGRIAIYKGGTLTQTGTMTAAGGRNGVDATGASFAGPGEDGTIYTAGVTATLQKACNPAPDNGNMAWSLDPNFAGAKTLSWNPALGSTQEKVYLGTTPGGMTLRATYAADANYPLLRKRITHMPSPALVNGTKYYWRVDSTVNGSPVTGTVWTFGVGTCSKPVGDMNGDCKVTFIDFAILGTNWRACNLVPASSCN